MPKRPPPLHISTMTGARILALLAALRRGSRTAPSLSAAIKLAPPASRSMRSISPTCRSIMATSKPLAIQPASSLKNAIRAADAVLVTPEYNHGVPGVMKTLVDWAFPPSARRRPQRGQTCRHHRPRRDKSARRAAKASFAKRSSSPCRLACPQPEISGFPRNREILTPTVYLTDAKTAEFLGKYLEALRVLTLRFK